MSTCLKSGIDGYLPEVRESKRLRSDDIEGIGELDDLCASRDGIRKESQEPEGDGIVGWFVSARGLWRIWV